jgi:predicted nuclease with TOPRIM domain
MTDIVNTLRGGFCEPNTGCMSLKMCICDLLGDAAEEIERLRNLVDQCDHYEHSLQEAQAEIERLRAKDQHWNDHLGTAQAEIKRLTACLKWEQNWLERVGTHAPGCWQWGPGHYMCAVRHIEEMGRDLK